MLSEYSAQNLEQLVSKIAEHGLGVIDHFIPTATTMELAAEISALHARSQLQQAGTGRNTAVINKELRGDQIYWLNEQEASAAKSTYFNQMESLRSELNQHLYLGLFALESHLAFYPAGTGYKKHLDRFKAIKDGKPLRQVSCILYLNQSWQESDGGQLRVSLQDSENRENNEMKHLDILPIAGRLVVFLSDTFYHEVIPATRDRMSLTGWFLTR